MDWNESTVPPSPKVKDALVKFANNGTMNWYPDVDNKVFRNLLSEYSKVPACNLEYFGSSDALHEYIIRSFVNPGDVITLISPTYDNFRAAAESIGATINYFPLNKDNTFSFSYLDFELHMQSICPKIVYLCNPNNPTGTNYSTEVIEKLVRRFNDVLFVIDEAYYEFSKITASSLVTKFENIIICRTFSKAFGLASFRVGYALGSENNINGLKRIRNPKNISSCAQVAAIAALNDIKYMEDYVNEVNYTKLWFIKELESIGVNTNDSEGGNFILLDLGINKSLVIKKMEDNNIFIRDYGHINTMEGYVRVTIGLKKQMVRVLEVLISLDLNEKTRSA
nr:histidinol-phosphate transaminase [Psychrosphaera sp. F3M07]